MHIVFVSREYTPTLRGGGIASYIRETAIGLLKRGHKVTVCCASDNTKEESEYTDNGIRVIRLSGGDFVISEKEKVTLWRKFRCLYRFYSYRRKIYHTIKRINDIDIIEVAEFGAEAFYLTQIDLPVTIRLHTPTLLDRDNAGKKKTHLNTFYEYQIGNQELKILPQFKYITSCSLSLKNWFTKYVPNLKPEIKVIYNSINIELWENAQSCSYEENSVLYVGTVAKEKGIGDLIEACKILRQETDIPITLKIAGKLGTYAQTLKQSTKEKGYDWCSFLGNQPREKLKLLYAQSKISCFPSWWENMPLVCLEAMLAGNIVIGSTNGGMAEIIENNINGYLVEPHNPRALALCLKNALEETKESVLLKKKNAYIKIKEKFSTQVILEKLEEYYLNTIKDYEKSKNIMG